MIDKIYSDADIIMLHSLIYKAEKYCEEHTCQCCPMDSQEGGACIDSALTNYVKEEYAKLNPDTKTRKGGKKHAKTHS